MNPLGEEEAFKGFGRAWLVLDFLFLDKIENSVLNYSFIPSLSPPISILVEKIISRVIFSIRCKYVI